MKDKNAFGMKADKLMIRDGLGKQGSLNSGLANLLAGLSAKYGFDVSEFEKLDPAPISKPPANYTGSRKTGDGRINPDLNAWKKQAASPTSAPAIARTPSGKAKAEDSIPGAKAAADSKDPMAVIEWNRAHENPDEKIMQSLSGLLSARAHSGETGTLHMLPFQVPVKNKFTIPKLKK